MVYGCACLTIVHILSVSTVYWKLQSMAMEWPSAAKCHVVKILKLGPIHMRKQHGDVIKLLFEGFKERK